MSSENPDRQPSEASPWSPEAGTEPTVPLRTEEPAEQSSLEEQDARRDDPVTSTTEPSAAYDVAGRRQLSVGHLVTGLVFLGISGLWLAQEAGAVDMHDMDLLVPVLLVVVGAAGLLAGLLRAARRP